METAELVRSYIESKTDLPFKAKFTYASKLSGGLANYVYRLRFDDATAVLKYFPRYLACDKTVEVSQNRYFVEKAALKHLSTNEFLLNETSVRIPKLFYADDESYILIMEDAGENIKTLFELLKNESMESSDSLIPFIAEQIKKFSSFLSYKSNINAKTNLNEFRNSTAWQIIPTYYTKEFKSQAKNLELEEELMPHFSKIDIFTESDYENTDTVLVFGDLWPNSILINSEKKLIWIVDWEMSRFKTSLYDMQQLIGNMWIMKQNSSLFNSNRIESLIKRLQFEFFGDENSDWRQSCPNGKSNFIFWVVVLIKEQHWEISNKKSSILQALKEIH